MRIGIASTTRSHLFDLARQVRRLGEHAHLFTELPRWKVDAELRDAVHCRSPLLPWTHRGERDFGRWLDHAVDKIPLDILDALDGLGLEAGRKVKQRGGAWLLHRGSAHILTERDLLAEEYRRWQQPLPGHWFDPSVIERQLEEYAEATGIVVPSRFAHRSFIEQGCDAGKIHLCPYGVDLQMFRQQKRFDRKFRAIFVGAQSIRSGIGYLLDAVRPLVQSGTLELWLVGPAASDARTILARNRDLFLRHGVQPASRLPWYLSQASVLILPSIESGLVLVQAQAMACGTPVIATENTGAEDLFTDGVEGFLVPPRDPAAIRERVEFLMDAPVRFGEMRLRAIDRAHSLGGWWRYGEMCRGVYRSVRPAAIGAGR